MTSELRVLQAPGRVLPTLNEDGTRRWLRPRLSRGSFFQRRRVLAYVLMLVFLLVPYIRIGGRPLLLLDLPRREFTFFGTTFGATETLLFMLLFGSIFLAIFLLTALLGRVWCGWACPQTVYMEFLFRPIEYWLEGGPRGTSANDARPGLKPRRLIKLGIYLVLAMFLAHTFLAYFVGIDTLIEWVQVPPAQNLSGFLVMLFTTGLIFTDFAWFREQTCLVACPYGRIQSVLLDRRSLIVGYDRRRGEPRHKGAKQRGPTDGDCIDCGMCVQTCPTGIDIRDGLQMECIHCTQCADACDAVMAKIGRPKGLIRYTSRDEIEGLPRRLLRWRVVLYPALLLTLLGAFAFTLGQRTDAEVTVLRGLGAPYTQDAEGRFVDQARVRIHNRASDDRRFQISLVDAEGVQMIAPQNPMPVPGRRMVTTTLFLVAAREAIPHGERVVMLRVAEGERFSVDVPYRMVGPQDDDDRHEPEGEH
jgi:cytochrome c oxidase accessory protein FixG